MKYIVECIVFYILISSLLLYPQEALEKEAPATEKFLDKIREIIKKITEKKQKKRNTIRKAIIRKKITEKLSTPRFLQPSHSIIKIKSNDQQAQRDRGKENIFSENKQLTTVPSSQISKDIKRIFKENPSLMPFKLPDFKKYFEKDEDLRSTAGSYPEKSEEKGKEQQDMVYREYMENLRQWFSEVALKSIQFWMFVKGIIYKIIEKNLYFDFIQKYCTPSYDLRRGFFDSPSLPNIFANDFVDLTILEQLSSLAYSSNFFSALQRSVNIATVKGRPNNICIFLLTISSLFSGHYEHLYIVNCLHKYFIEKKSNPRECENIKRDVRNFYKLSKRYFKYINDAIPQLLELQFFVNDRMVEREERDNRGNILNLLYQLVYREEFLDTITFLYLLKYAMARVREVDDSGFCSQKQFQERIATDVDKLKEQLRYLFFSDSFIWNMEPSIAVSVEELYNKLLSLYAAAEKISRVNYKEYTARLMKFDNDIQKLRKGRNEWLDSIKKLSSQEQFCVAFYMAIVKGEIIRVDDVKIREKLSSITMKAGSEIGVAVPEIVNLSARSFLALLDPQRLFLRYRYGMPFNIYLRRGDSPLTLDSKISLITFYLYKNDTVEPYSFITAVDVIIAIAEHYYVMKKCLGEVNSVEEYINTAALFDKFWDAIIKKNDFLLYLQQNDSQMHAVLNEFLDKVFKGSIPSPSPTRIDEFFDFLMKNTAGKNFSDFLSGNKACCSSCNKTPECNFYQRGNEVCKILLGRDLSPPQPINKELLKSLCPQEGLKECGSQKCRLCIGIGMVDSFVELGLSDPNVKIVQCESACSTNNCSSIAERLKDYVDMFTTNYNGKNFCEVIDNFYSCCENCTDCKGTVKFCFEKIPPINYRKEYLKELKGVVGENLFNILMTRIKKFDTLPPFSSDAIREIQTDWDFSSIGFQCK